MKDSVKCKGRFYRMKIHQYVDKRERIHRNITIYPLKKMSCPGCDECKYTDEFLREHIETDCYFNEIIGGEFDGGIYKLVCGDNGEIDDVYVNLKFIKHFWVLG